jgi:hypothetical protein
MPSNTKPLLGAAALSVIALVACSPAPTPSEATAPSVAVVPSEATPMAPTDGPLEAGTYRIGDEAGITLTLPDGWDASNGGTDLRKHRDQPGELIVWVDTSDDIGVYTDACANQDPPPTAGPTEGDLLTALRSQQQTVVSEPVTVPIGGRDVTRLVISTPDGLDLTTCTEGIFRIWKSRATGYLATSDPGPSTVHLVQTPAGRVVFGFRPAPDASESDIAELDAVIASMVIEP